MPRCKVGFREGIVQDQNRSNWSGDGPRPLRWSAWYPAENNAVERRVTAAPGRSPFVMGAIAPSTALNGEIERFPVVLLSHGTGGRASSISWLAQGLAAAGSVVLGVDHHGNTASEPYKAEGFLCWWERPRDLSMVLDVLAEDGVFAGRLDTSNVVCVGFSLGGYTALSILGAITDVNRFREWAGCSPFGQGPREFPRLAENIAALLRDSVAFRASWGRQAASYLDRRVRAAVALAPGPTVRAFSPASLATIDVPVTIIVGDADREAPADLCSAWLHEQLQNSQLHFLGREVGHYTLLCEGTEEGRRLEPDLYVDAPGVDRSEIHRRVLMMTLAAIGTDQVGDGA